jgi:hypothetical protein
MKAPHAGRSRAAEGLYAPSAFASDALLFGEPFFFLRPGYPLHLFRSGLCRSPQVFSEVTELVQFALLGGKQFLKQILVEFAAHAKLRNFLRGAEC